MSLKAGRVGVAPDQVDGFGKIKSEATAGYTKQEADAKFETQAAATSALAEKQPITLEVPIEMLSGTALTVEDALQGLNDEITDISTAQESVVENIVSGASVESSVNYLVKQGKVVCCSVYLQSITAEAWSTICVIPNGFRPKNKLLGLCWSNVSKGFVGAEINDTNGAIQFDTACSNNKVRVSLTWETA